MPYLIKGFDKDTNVLGKLKEPTQTNAKNDALDVR